MNFRALRESEVRFAPVLRGSGLSVTMPRGGTRPGEEVRDGSYADNRGRGNRGGIVPPALRLLRVGAGTAGPCTTLEAALDSHPARPSLATGPTL